MIMCCSPHRFAVRAATHYHTRAWQTFIYGKECFILLLNPIKQETLLEMNGVMKLQQHANSHACFYKICYWTFAK